jgi:hypothetical protein
MELGVSVGEVYIDYPEKKAMFALDMLVERRGGEVLRLGPAGRTGLIGLPSVADELYRTARVLRLFVGGRRQHVDPTRLGQIAQTPISELQDALENGQSLLS